MSKFKKSTKNNVKFIDSDKLYEKFVDKKSMLIQIHNLIDFEHYRSVLDSLYSDHGRKAYDCIFMFKLCLLQYLKGGLSDREVISQAKSNLEYRYYLNLGIDDELPHFTKLGKFRSRVGKENFQDLFDFFVELLKENNIITDDQIRYMDATHQLADVTKVSINVLLNKACEDLLFEINKLEKYQPKTSIDLEKKDFLLDDEESKTRFISLVELGSELKEKAKDFLGYENSKDLKSSYEILRRIIRERSKLKDDRIVRENSDDVGKLASLSDKDATWGAKSKENIFLGYKHNVTAVEGGFIEVISTHQGHKNDEEFYLEDAKKSSGKKIVADKIYGSKENREESEKMNKQLVAPCKKNMKAHLHDDVMDRAFIYNKTEKYKTEMKNRGSLIEGMFGVMKKVNHFARAKYRSMEKVSIQAIISAFVVNLKATVRWFKLA